MEESVAIPGEEDKFSWRGSKIFALATCRCDMFLPKRVHILLRTLTCVHTCHEAHVCCAFILSVSFGSPIPSVVCHQPVHDGKNQVVESLSEKIIFMGPNPNEKTEFPSELEQQVMTVAVIMRLCDCISCIGAACFVCKFVKRANLIPESDVFCRRSCGIESLKPRARSAEWSLRQKKEDVRTWLSSSLVYSYVFVPVCAMMHLGRRA